MHQFHYKDQNLHCEAVDLAAVARLYGTPTYVYSATTMAENLERLRQAFAGVDLQVCYAVKANGNLAVLRHFSNLGTGFDVVSGGEIRRVIAAGGHLRSSVFAGVGKSDDEIRLALENEIFAFHVESEPELARINHVAGRLGVIAPVALRINPDVEARTHAKISTGGGGHKFGLPLRLALAAAEAMAKLKHVRLRGVQLHLGSQQTRVDPLAEAVARVAPLAAELKRTHEIEYFSIGGGMGIAYQDALASGRAEWWQAQPPEKRPATAAEFGAVLLPLLAPLELRIMVEPGRLLTANAGVLLARVEYLKRGAGKNFLVIDAGMNDLVRPAMYDSYHEIVPLQRDTTRPALVADVVGPVCETADCFARDRRLQEQGEGELLAILSAGAYGFAMAGRYNSRPLPAEVLVQGSSFELVNARESFEQQVANEKIPAFLQ